MDDREVILKVENLSKQYRLGLVGTGTLSHDLNRWWHRIRGKEDPYLKIGETNDRSTKGESEYVWALRDINFEVRRGEVLGIIGKNGAGKSTLLKILSRVTSPTTGSVKTKGRIASLLEVGTGFHGEMTGRENIYLNGAILGMTKKEITSKIDEIIEFSGCERYIDTPVKRYSSGMTVRLAFAVAAFLEPDILIVDEVLAVGDAEFQKKAIGKMQDISSGEGRAVLFVSHNMSAISNLCEKVLLIKSGEVFFEGNPEITISKYYELNSKKSTGILNGLSKKANVSLMELYSSKNFKFQTGQKMEFNCVIKNLSREIVNSIHLDVKFDNHMGNRVFWGSTKSSLNSISLYPEEIKELVFEFERNPFIHGEYFISYNLTSQFGIEENIQHFISFQVIDGLFYNRHLNIGSRHAPNLLNYKVFIGD